MKALRSHFLIFCQRVKVKQFGKIRAICIIFVPSEYLTGIYLHIAFPDHGHHGVVHRSNRRVWVRCTICCLINQFTTEFKDRFVQKIAIIVQR